jgi:hypothetical protein
LIDDGKEIFSNMNEDLLEKLKLKFIKDLSQYEIQEITKFIKNSKKLNAIDIIISLFNILIFR